MNIEVTYRGRKVETFQVVRLFSIRYEADGESEHGKLLRIVADVNHYLQNHYLQLAIGPNYASMESYCGWKHLKPGNDIAWRELPLSFLEEHADLLFPDDDRFEFKVSD